MQFYRKIKKIIRNIFLKLSSLKNKKKKKETKKYKTSEKLKNSR